MLILGNYKGNYDTATTTAIKSMGFDSDAIETFSQSYVRAFRCNSALLYTHIYIVMEG